MSSDLDAWLSPSRLMPEFADPSANWPVVFCVFLVCVCFWWSVAVCLVEFLGRLRSWVCEAVLGFWGGGVMCVFLTFCSCVGVLSVVTVEGLLLVEPVVLQGDARWICLLGFSRI